MDFFELEYNQTKFSQMQKMNLNEEDPRTRIRRDKKLGE